MGAPKLVRCQRCVSSSGNHAVDFRISHPVGVRIIHTFIGRRPMNVANQPAFSLGLGMGRSNVR